MQLLLSMYPQLLQVGLAAPEHVSYAFGRLVEALGYKNVSDFIFPPDIIKQAEMMGVPPQMLMMRFVNWLPDMPAHAHADRAKPWMVEIFSIPNLLNSSVGRVENPPP